MQENIVETEGVKHARACGWRVYKAASPGNRGQLDRVHHKAGFTFYIEYKRPGKKATMKQRARALELSSSGIPCRCYDNIDKAKAFISEITNAVMFDDYEKLSIMAADISTF